LAILFPVVLAIVLAMFQTALWAHAGSVAQAAAEHGADVAATFGADDAQGTEAAHDYAANAGTIRDVAVTASNAPNSELVSVTVTGTYPSVFGSLSISSTATAVRERVSS